MAAIDFLRAWAGIVAPARESHRPLTEAELRRLDGGVVEVGAHSVTHPSLATLSAEEQRYEVRHSKAWLEAALGRTVATFAYPFGDRSPAAASLVREAGFEAACTTEAAPVEPGRDLFELPRVAVGDWSGAEFARRWEAGFPERL